MSKWFLVRDGREQGPYDDAQLRKLAADGVVSPNDLIRRDSSPTGVSAKTINGLFAASAASTAKRPPPPPPRVGLATSNPPAAASTPKPQLSEWHYAQNNVQHGPATFSQLKDLASSGRLRPTDLVWKVGTPNWREARTVQGLFSLPTNNTVPSSPPPIASTVLPPTTSVTGAAIWNPTVVRVLGFFFTWAFGAFLLARNWKALGEMARSKRSMIWFYSFFGWVVLAFITPDTEAVTKLFWFAGLAIFVCWANFEAQPQIKYVKERFGSSYPRKGWLIPIGSVLGIGFVGVICLMLAGVMAVLDEYGMLDSDASGEDQYVMMVKQGSLDAHPGILVGPVVDNFLSNPKWSSGVTSTGQRFVNAEGGMSYHNKPVRAVVQFFVSDRAFEFHAFEMNGIPQNKLISMALFAKMYEEFEK